MSIRDEFYAIAEKSIHKIFLTGTLSIILLFSSLAIVRSIKNMGREVYRFDGNYQIVYRDDEWYTRSRYSPLVELTGERLTIEIGRATRLFRGVPETGSCNLVYEEDKFNPLIWSDGTENRMTLRFQGRTILLKDTLNKRPVRDKRAKKDRLEEIVVGKETYHNNYYTIPKPALEKDIGIIFREGNTFYKKSRYQIRERCR